MNPPQNPLRWLAPAVWLAAALTASAESPAPGGFGTVATVASVAALRASRLPNPAPSAILAEGYYEPGDGGGGIYYPRPNDKDADDGGSVIIGADQTRYSADPAGLSDLRRWGLKPNQKDASGSAAAKISRVVLLNQRMHRPTRVYGRYLITEPIVLEGDGWVIEGGAPFGGGGPQDGFYQTNPLNDAIEIKNGSRGRIQDIRITGNAEEPNAKGAAIHVFGRVTRSVFANIYASYMGAGFRTTGDSEVSVCELRNLSFEACHSGLYGDDSSQFYNNVVGPLNVFGADERPIWIGVGTQNTWSGIHMSNTQEAFRGKPIRASYEAGTKLIRMDEAAVSYFVEGDFVQQSDILPRRVSKVTRLGLEIEEAWVRSWTDSIVRIVPPSSGVMFHTLQAQQTISGLNIEWQSAPTCVSAGDGGDMIITSMHVEGWCPSRAGGPAYLLAANVQLGSLEVVNSILDSKAVHQVGIFGNANSGEIGDLFCSEVEAYGNVYVAPVLYPALHPASRVSIRRTRFLTGQFGWWHDAPIESPNPFAVERVGDREYAVRRGDAYTVYTDRLITNRGAWTPGDRQVVRQGESSVTYACQGSGGTFGAPAPSLRATLKPGSEFGYFSGVDGLYPREWLTVEGQHVRIQRLPKGGMIRAGAAHLAAESPAGGRYIELAEASEAARISWGDFLVAGLGTPDEEFFQVLRVDRVNRGRVYVDRPLARRHAAGETVATAVQLDRVFRGTKPAVDAEVSLTPPRFAVVAGERE